MINKINPSRLSNTHLTTHLVERLLMTISTTVPTQTPPASPQKKRKFTVTTSLLSDIVQLIATLPAPCFVMSEHEPKALSCDVKEKDKLVLRCTQCQALSSHSVSTIKAHVKAATSLVCPHCAVLQRSPFDSADFKVVQAHVPHFHIDKATYQGEGVSCIHTCVRCAQRHWITPKFAAKHACIRQRNFPIPSITAMPTLADFDALITALSNWQLSPTPSHQRFNALVFKQRFLSPLPLSKFILCCKRHPDKVKQIPHASFLTQITSNSCRQCGADALRKYTPAYLERAFKKAGYPLKIDVLKSNLTSRQDFIPNGALLTLSCPKHGALPQKTAYALQKFLVRYKTSTPCSACDPHSGTTINALRVRQYSESQDRFNTHGALYDLVDSNETIEANIAALIAAKQPPYFHLSITLRVRMVAEAPLFTDHQDHEFTLLYHQFCNGKRGFMAAGHTCSWTAKFIAFLNIEWKLGLEAEKTFKGLKSEKGYLLSIDFYQPTLQRAYEVDGKQHISEHSQIRVKKDRKAKFAEQVRRDEVVDEYFRVHPKMTLLRLPTYRIRKKTIEALRVKLQFDNALAVCRAIYVALYQQSPPNINKASLMRTSRQPSPVLDKKLARINAIYGGILKAHRVSISEQVTLSCQHGHYMQATSSKCTYDARHVDVASSTPCWGCQLLEMLPPAKARLLQQGFYITNEADILSHIDSSLDAPLAARVKLPNVIVKVAQINGEAMPTKRDSLTLKKVLDFNHTMGLIRAYSKNT